jgi:NADH:ubiquinone oxidoreductase subunit 6 (subunit J)
MNYPRPVIAAMAVMTGIKTLLASAAVTELVDGRIVGVILALILAVEVGVAFYVQGRVVPLQQTVIYEDEHGEARAGDAALTVATGALVKPTATVAGLTADPIEPGPGWR